MGGYNSGGGRGALKASAFWRLDIARLRRMGVLGPGYWPIRWKGGNGETLASINIASEEDRLTLHYTVKGQTPNDSQRIQETIFLDWTEQPFGGKRVWFLCPHCHSRRGILYGRVRYLCRKCHGLTYDSQYDPYPQLPWTRCHRVRERLGGDDALSSPFPRKPKGMHHKTYERLRDEDLQASMLLDEALEIGTLEGIQAIAREYRKCGEVL